MDEGASAVGVGKLAQDGVLAPYFRDLGRISKLVGDSVERSRIERRRRVSEIGQLVVAVGGRVELVVEGNSLVPVAATWRSRNRLQSRYLS